MCYNCGCQEPDDPMGRGGEQVFIVNTDAENEQAAEDQIRYLVNNSLEVLSIEQIKMHD